MLYIIRIGNSFISQGFTGPMARLIYFVCMKETYSSFVTLQPTYLSLNELSLKYNPSWKKINKYRIVII